VEKPIILNNFNHKVQENIKEISEITIKHLEDLTKKEPNLVATVTAAKPLKFNP
jgi:hypothetical protein